MMISIFYQEPDSDRWMPFDRYPRKFVRRIIRGRRRPGGPELVYINLKAGLDRLGVSYRDNDYRYARKNASSPVGIIGKSHLLDRQWHNPIMFGASVTTHPMDDPELFGRQPIKRVLVPGEWLRQMFESTWGDQVYSWPVGIDSEYWCPRPQKPDFDVLIYDKIRWEHDHYESILLEPTRRFLATLGLSFREVRYGHYEEGNYHDLVRSARAMIFFCEHETQGLAYQQALSAGTPVFAWDRGGVWKDPSFYPERLCFGPVCSVPYWDERCGEKFYDFEAASESFPDFWDKVLRGVYKPRDYILDNLTLELGAQAYLRHWKDAFDE